MELTLIFNRFAYGLKHTFNNLGMGFTILALVGFLVYYGVYLCGCYWLLFLVCGFYYLMGFDTDVAEMTSYDVLKSSGKYVITKKANQNKSTKKDLKVSYSKENKDEDANKKEISLSMSNTIVRNELKAFNFNSRYVSTDDNIVYLGQDTTDDITLDLGVNQHTIIGGQTGMGKTNIIMSMIHQVLSKGWKVCVIDDKGDDFPIFENVCDIVYDIDKARGMIDKLLEEMEIRSEYFKVATRQTGKQINNIDVFNQRHNPTMQRILFVIDESSTFFACDKKEREELVVKMQKLLAQGRSKGIHMILATQIVNADNIPTRLIQLCANRIATRLDSKNLSITVIGNDYASRIGQTPGRCCKIINGENKEFQTPYFNAEKDLKNNYRSFGRCFKI